MGNTKKYPERVRTHIQESKSVDIVKSLFPEEWIVREVTEKDYGIDLYVEIVEKDGMVKGDLLSLQMKGPEEINFNEQGKTSFSGIKKSTINYWLGYGVPVFFVAVDLKTKTAYWSNIRKLERVDWFSKDQETYSIPLNKIDVLNTEEGLLLFSFEYLREKMWPKVQEAITQSLLSYNSLGPLCLICNRKNKEDNCSATIQNLIDTHYQNYWFMSTYFFVKKVKRLDEWYEIGKRDIEKTMRMTYGKICEMIQYFIMDYLDEIKQIHSLVMKYSYYDKAFLFLRQRLIDRPLIFNEADWYPRYYFDEYENETWRIEHQFFEDFTDFDDQEKIPETFKDRYEDFIKNKKETDAN